MNATKHSKAHGLSRMSAVAAVLLALASPSSAMSQTSDGEPIAKARQAVAALAGDLRKNLEEALRADGPLGALGVCHAIAPEATRSQSAAHGMTIKRTAFRVRNSANAPDAHERRVLESFAAKIAEGSNPADLEDVETVTEGDVRTLRYMKPIMMAEKPCAACHGSSVAPDVSDKIRELYPHDAATGFAPGELRGAFSVSIPLPPNP